MDNNTIRTLGQVRSAFALKQINKHLDLPELKTFSAGVPSMILQNGLGHTLAFCYAKKKNKPHMAAILAIVETWIIKHPQFTSSFLGKRGKDFLMALSEVDQNVYLAVQEETLALLEWVKRYASAFIHDVEGNGK